MDGKVGFHVVAEEDNKQGMRWIEIAPKSGAETSIILHNKEVISKMSPELNLGTPSLMFFSENLDRLYTDLTNKNVTVGEMVTMPSGKVLTLLIVKELFCGYGKEPIIILLCENPLKYIEGLHIEVDFSLES